MIHSLEGHPGIDALETLDSTKMKGKTLLRIWTNERESCIDFLLKFCIELAS